MTEKDLATRIQQLLQQYKNELTEKAYFIGATLDLANYGMTRIKITPDSIKGLH